MLRTKSPRRKGAQGSKFNLDDLAKMFNKLEIGATRSFSSIQRPSRLTNKYRLLQFESKFSKFDESVEKETHDLVFAKEESFDGTIVLSFKFRSKLVRGFSLFICPN